jgi:hypothetical protein
MSQLEDELIDAGKLALQLIEHIRSIDSRAVVAFSQMLIVISTNLW